MKSNSIWLSSDGFELDTIGIWYGNSFSECWSSEFERNERIPKKMQLLVQKKCMVKSENIQMQSAMQETLYWSLRKDNPIQAHICVFWYLALMRTQEKKWHERAFSIFGVLRVYVCPDCKPFENIRMRAFDVWLSECTVQTTRTNMLNFWFSGSKKGYQRLSISELSVPTI